MQIRIMEDGTPAIILPSSILLISKKDYNFRRLLRSTYNRYSKSRKTYYSKLSLEPNTPKKKESESISNDPINISNLFRDKNSNEQ